MKPTKYVWVCVLAYCGLALADVAEQAGTSSLKLADAASSDAPGPAGRGRIALPEAVYLPVLGTESMDSMRKQYGPSWLGPMRSVPAGIEGRWAWTQTGERVWRLRIRVPGARALRVYFEGFSTEGPVWLYGDEWNGPYIGPYDGSGPHADGSFWSEFVYGESVTIEYAPRVGTAISDQVPLRILRIAQVVSNAFPVPGKPDRAPGGLRPRSLAGCHLDVSCYPVLEDRAAPSVAKLYIEKDEGTYVCTGFLINPRYDSESSLLLLTAGHCIRSEAEAQSVSLLWNYQTSECYGNPHWMEWDEPLVRTYGARLVVSKDDDTGDFALLELDKNNVGSATPWSSRGWTIRDIHTGEQVANVSHPDGSHKRAAIGRVVDVNFRDESLQGIQWRIGTTEPGSSGSPVLVYHDEFEDWVATGVLVGSTSDGVDDDQPWGAYCAEDVIAAFDPLSRVWETIQPYLESENELRGIVDDDHGNTASLATSLAVGASVEGRIEPGDDIDYFRLDLQEQIAVRIFTTGSLDTVGGLLDSSDEPLKTNDDAGQSTNFLISGTLRPGTFYVRVKSFGRRTGDYTLHVESENATTGANEYRALQGWVISAGTMRFSVSGATVRTSGGCSGRWSVTANGNSYLFHNSKWQRRAGHASAWADIPGSFRQAMCSYSPNRNGEYRAVADISVNGQRNTYVTENTLRWP